MQGMGCNELGKNTFFYEHPVTKSADWVGFWVLLYSNIMHDDRYDMRLDWLVPTSFDLTYANLTTKKSAFNRTEVGFCFFSKKK